jgi:uncharacterized protein
MRALAAFVLTLVVASFATADDQPKKILFVTHSGGFIHASVGTAEDVLNNVAAKHGYAVTTWRYTGDPQSKDFLKYQEKFRASSKKPVESEHCGRINAQTLKGFDAVLFFTTGSTNKKSTTGPLTETELADLTAWVNAGGAFCGTHCASDTMYDSTYGELIGGYFKGHPHQQKVKLKLEDPKHPAAAGMKDGMEWLDEYYMFHDQPYSRDKLHIILSIDKSTLEFANPNDKDKDSKIKRLSRADGDYAVAWCKSVGKGKVFYTSLGHRDDVWQSDAFQQHLFGGIDWAVGKKPGDASPSKK